MFTRWNAEQVKIASLFPVLQYRKEYELIQRPFRNGYGTGAMG